MKLVDWSLSATYSTTYVYKFDTHILLVCCMRMTMDSSDYDTSMISNRSRFSIDSMTGDTFRSDVEYILKCIFFSFLLRWCSDGLTTIAFVNIFIRIEKSMIRSCLFFCFYHVNIYFFFLPHSLSWLCIDFRPQEHHVTRSKMRSEFTMKKKEHNQLFGSWF